MSEALKLVILGLSLSSAWGNGHATTYRALISGLAAEGHDVLFLERDVPWYAENRDLSEPDYCGLAFYRSLDELRGFLPEIRSADTVIIGSYVPEGREIIDLLVNEQLRLLAYYDIDTPVTLANLDRGEERYLARRQIPLFDLYLSFAGGRSLAALKGRYGANKAVPLYCSVDPDQYRNTGQSVRWDLGYLGTYSVDREPKLERLLLDPARRRPDLRFVVAGSQYPNDIIWPDNVERIEHIEPSAHPAFYSCQRFTLNLTRADMVESGFAPSVRLFEAAACATPIIGDRWHGLDTILPEGEAILIADSATDVVTALTDLSVERRQAIADEARKRILAAHTGRARAKELIGHLQAVAGRPATIGFRTSA